MPLRCRLIPPGPGNHAYSFLDLSKRESEVRRPLVQGCSPAIADLLQRWAQSGVSET